MAFLVATNGGVRYPPPVEPLPDPKPIDQGEMPDAARKQWQSAEALDRQVGAIKKGSSGWQDLAGHPELIPRLRALAKYRLACHLKATGKWQKAWSALSTLSESDREVATETGLPLGVYIDFQRISVLPHLSSKPARSKAVISEIVARAIFEPKAVSPAIMEAGTKAMRAIAGNEDDHAPGSDPDSLYPRQRRRTFWFGALIAVSVATVIAGFVVSRRGYKEQQRLNALKTDFVSSVSHEIRAPIASMRLMGEELRDICDDQTLVVTDYHRSIVQGCRRMSVFIENVLDFARYEQGRKQYSFEERDVAALVESAAQQMQLLANDRRVKVEVAVECETPLWVMIDRTAVRQVLLNLLDNAIRHSPQEGPVKVGLATDGGWARLTVADEGPGIPKEEQARIFEEFYRCGSELRRETQGVGLGLALVKRAVEAHGGSISVESEPGSGSEFRVVIPIMKA